MIFVSGSAFVTLTTAVSLSVTFLLLDRIFILTFPMQYKQNRAVFIFVTIVACATIVVLILGALIMTELPVDRKTSELFGILTQLLMFNTYQTIPPKNTSNYFFI